MKKRQEIIQNLQEEVRLRKLIRQGISKIYEQKRSKPPSEEARLRQIIKNLILEAKKDQEIHQNTGINELAPVLDNIYIQSKRAYKRLTTSPDQRKVFLKTWEWFFKELLSGDIKRRNVAVKAADKVDKEGFKEDPVSLEEETVDIKKVDDEDLPMSVDDNMKADLPEDPPSAEELEDLEVDKLITSPKDPDKAGAKAAMDLFKATKNQVLDGTEDLYGEDAELYYKYFFINMLGSKDSGFEEETDKPIVGHFQRAEKELEALNIPVSSDLLPPPEEVLSPKETEF